MTSLPAMTGRAAFIFDEPNFDVDRIVGPEWLPEQNIHKLVAVAMASFDPGFANVVERGDFLIGGANFGYGHPHYPPMRAMRHLGIAAVIADSFAPGYWREEMEEGFPQITCPGISSTVTRWDKLTVDFEAATILNYRTQQALTLEAFSRAETNMLIAGGLTAYLHQRMGTTN